MAWWQQGSLSASGEGHLLGSGGKCFRKPQMTSDRPQMSGGTIQARRVNQQTLGRSYSIIGQRKLHRAGGKELNSAGVEQTLNWLCRA